MSRPPACAPPRAIPRDSLLIDSRGSDFIYWVKILLPQEESFFLRRASPNW